LVSGVTVSLGRKTSSYRQWFESLKEYGQSSVLSDQKEYWDKAVKNYSPLPVDRENSEVVYIQDTSHHIVRLGLEQTRLLLQEVPGIYHTEINDILLCALAVTLGKWSGGENVMIGLEGHGREHISESIDTSRTVGWFTSLFPVSLKVDVEKKTGDWIKSVKEQLRQVPDKGLGYGVLKYITKETALQGTYPWDIVFNYLGQLDNIVKESKWFGGAAESGGTAISEKQELREKLSVNCFIGSGELVLNWRYSSIHYKPETIEKIASEYISNLSELINHCMQQQKGGNSFYTPSDYGLGKEISYEELDQFLEEESDENIMSF
ncbi:MAG TPA: condensation domain-containing protein, partial [Segetibacter sp.]